MARVVLSGLLQDIRGGLGASTFSAWKGINYMRNKAITVSNPQTVKQMAMRQFFALSVSNYRGLTDVQKALWEEYAQQLKGTNSADEVVGDSGIIPKVGMTQSGMNAYIGVNQQLKGSAQVRVSVPPVPPDVGATSFILLLGTAATVHVEFVATPNPEAKTRKLEVWMKGWWKGAHSYIAAVADVPEPPGIPDPILISTIRKGSADTIEEVPFTTLVPCEVFVQGIIVRADGNRSVSTALHRVKVIA